MDIKGHITQQRLIVTILVDYVLFHIIEPIQILSVLNFCKMSKIHFLVKVVLEFSPFTCQKNCVHLFNIFQI